MKLPSPILIDKQVKDYKSFFHCCGKSMYKQTQFLIDNWKDYTILKDVSAIIELEKKSVAKHHGDHAVFFFDVASFKTFSENNILSFQDLVKSRII